MLLTETKRPRYENNERFDQADAQAEGDLRLQREMALVRGLVGGTPIAGFSSGQGESVGTVLQAGAISSPGANQIQLASDLFIAVDTNGLMLIKSVASGVLTYNNVPAGQSTLYAYGIDSPTDSGQRFFMPSSAPYDEFAKGISTRYTLNVGLLAVAGTGTVNEAVINNGTRGLVAIALLNNAAGVVTVTTLFNNQLQSVPPLQLPLTLPTITNQGVAGVTTYSYVLVVRTRNGSVVRVSLTGTTNTGNAVLSGSNYNKVAWFAVPDATDYRVYRTAGGATQGLIGTVQRSGNNALYLNDTGLVADGSSVPADTFGAVTTPAASTDRGSSVSTLYALSKTTLSLLADAKFKGVRSASAGLQTAANNYLAYAPLRNGIDTVDRATPNVVTVGDGVTTFGLFDLVDYPSADQMLTAAMNYASSIAVLDGQVTVLLKAGLYIFTGSTVVVPSNVRLVGEQTPWPNSSSGSAATIVLGSFQLQLSQYATMERLHIKKNLNAITGASDPTSQVVLTGHNIVRDCYFSSAFAAGFTGTGLPILATSGSPVPDIRIQFCRFLHDSAITATTVFTNGVNLTAAIDASVEGCTFYANNMTTGAAPATMLTLNTCQDVRVVGCKFYSGRGAGVPNSVTPLAVVTGLANANANPVRFIDCDFVGGDAAGAMLAQTPSSLSQRGIYCNDTACYEVARCTFQNLPYGIYQEVRSNRGTLETTNVHHSRFYNMGVAALVVTNPTNSALTVNGVYFNDNQCVNMRNGVLLRDTDGAGSLIVNDVSFDRNRFITFNAVDGASGNPVAVTLNGSLFRWSCRNNSFSNVTNTPVYFWVKTSGINWSISDNFFEQCQLSAAGQNSAASWAGIIGNEKLDGSAQNFGALKNIVIVRNQAYNVNPNVTAGTPNSLIAFGADSITDLCINDNQLADVSPIIGGGGGRGFCIEIRPYTSLIGVKVVNNQLGAQSDTSRITGIRLFAGSFASSLSHQWLIANNQIYFRYDNTATTTGGGSLPGWNYIIQCQLGNASVYHSNLSIEGNQIHLVAASATTGTFNNHVYRITGYDADAVSFLNNQIHISQAGTQFSASTGASMVASNGGAISPANSYKIIGNSCCSAGSATDTLFAWTGRLAGAGAPVPANNFLANTSAA